MALPRVAINRPQFLYSPKNLVLSVEQRRNESAKQSFTPEWITVILIRWDTFHFISICSWNARPAYSTCTRSRRRRCCCRRTACYRLRNHRWMVEVSRTMDRTIVITTIVSTISTTTITMWTFSKPATPTPCTTSRGTGATRRRPTWHPFKVNRLGQECFVCKRIKYLKHEILFISFFFSSLQRTCPRQGHWWPPPALYSCSW